MQKYTSRMKRYDNLKLKLYLRDMKSAGGTYVNEIRIVSGTENADVELHSKDIIRLGDDCELGGGIFKCIYQQYSIAQLS
jgi:pSer/pThr/pTyr-binding forkhead associated (FHA) protein